MPAAFARPPMPALPTKSKGMCVTQKLRLDKSRSSSLPACMDDDTTELIARLGTRIGMIMEDVGEIALTLGPMKPADRVVAINALDKAATAISAMVAALRTIDG